MADAVREFRNAERSRIGCVDGPAAKSWMTVTGSQKTASCIMDAPSRFHVHSKAAMLLL